MSEWDLKSATECVSRNGGSVRDNRVTAPKRPGIKVWGAIDYLVNHQKHTVIMKED